MIKTDYELLDSQLHALLDDERDALAATGNFVALLYNALAEINWLGVYVLRGDELVLGPFQGKPACVHIALDEGVCGAAASTLETQRVADVHAFPGHIACDVDSRSELVVPLIVHDQLIGVLDIDSPITRRFSGHVLARAGIDLDCLPLIHEQRHAHNSTCRKGCRLHATTCRIALNAGVCLNDFEFDEVGRRNDQRRVIPKRDAADITIAYPVFRVTYSLGIGPILLERVLHHEVPELAVGVEILHFGVHDVSRFNRIAGFERLVDRLARFQVPDTSAIERLAFARFYEFVIDNNARIAVNNDPQARLELVGAVICHGYRSLKPIRRLVARRYDTGVTAPRQPNFRPEIAPNRAETRYRSRFWTPARDYPAHCV
jgi:GAF domain-containing protein